MKIQKTTGPRSINRTNLNNNRRRAGTNPRRKPHHIGATNTIKRRNLQRRRTKLTRIRQRSTTQEDIKQKCKSHKNGTLKIIYRRVENADLRFKDSVLGERIFYPFR
uniref:Uncharacterized protein n=1 Tax=Trichogramma kaykai TaxID=54128 RepID=A0ABD2W440_9HYME